MKSITVMKSMFKKRIIYILAIVIAVGLVVMSFALPLSANTVQAESVISGTIEPEYYFGENFKVPSASINVDGTPYVATATVIKPDGSVIRASELILDVAGKYDVKYEVKVNGKLYYDIKSFNVYKPLYEVSGGGTVSYGEEDRLENAYGVKLALTSDSVFRLNRKINIYNLGNDNPFIKFHILPEKEGYAELNKLFIKVIDANDSDTFFVLQVKHFSTWITATENAHIFGHINNFSTNYSGSIICDPQHANWSGTVLKTSFEGETSKNGPIKNQSISFYFSEIGQEITALDSTGVLKTVLSLGSFPNVWSGFTTGDVYIEIFGKDLMASKANIFIDDIAGIDLSAGINADNEAPVITIDYGDVGADIPQGYVNCSYPIFDATAFDYAEGYKEVVKSVYYNYYSNSRAMVSIENGRFTPQRAGKYTIVYTASDRFSNVATEYVDVIINDSSAAPAFIYSVTPGYKTSGNAAEKINLAEVAFSGNVFNYDVFIEITKGDNSYEFDISDNSFTAMETGTFTVKYTAVDFLNRKCEFTYNIEISASDVPVFTVEPETLFPERLIVGYKNKLSELNAVYIGSDNVKRNITATISASSGTIDNGYYTPTSTGDITFTCNATYDGHETTKYVTKKAYSIKNDNKIDFKSLFIRTDGNVESTYNTSNNYAEYKFTGEGKIEYLNNLLSENASLQLNTDASFKEISEMIVRFYNPKDRSRYIETIIKSFDGAVYTSVDGQEFKAVSRGDFSGSNPIEINYVDYKKAIIINGVTYAVGKDYKGIGSDYVIAEIEVKTTGTTSVYGLIVQKVGNQTLKSDTTSDRLAPMIACVGDYGGSYEKGTTYVLPKIIATDMVSPSIGSFKMTITDPSGNYVRVNGVELNGVTPYQAKITLNSYGQYYCEYEVKDQANRTESFGFAINVNDTIAPNVWISGSYATTGTVGSAITIANFKAVDNLDSADTLNKRILILNTNHNFVLIKENTFTPDKAGTYVVYCYVTDSFGNVGLCYYNIEVK